MNAEEFAARVGNTFGVTPLRHGREYRVPCVVHEADGGVHNPSLAVWDIGPERCAFKCMTGCPQSMVSAALKARGIPVGRHGRVSVAQQLAAARAEETRRRVQITEARDCLYMSAPLLSGDPVDKYLKNRGIDYGLVGGIASINMGDDPIYKQGIAMISPVCALSTLRDKVFHTTGVASLSLNDDGTPKLLSNGKKMRSNVGIIKGMAVPLGMPGPKLVVGEGVESTLAAMILLDIPFGAATLSSFNMPELGIPEWVTELHVAMDNDEAGLVAGRKLDFEWMGMTGVNANLHRWGELRDGYDAADELLRQRGPVV